jgi:hypothetical protein
MSEGAMMSQPASACDQRLLHQHGDRLVIEMTPSRNRPSCRGCVRDRAHVAEDTDLRHLLLDGANGAADKIVRIERLAARLVAQLGSVYGKERDAGNVQFGSARGFARTISSTDSRSTPGIDGTGVRCVRAVHHEHRPDQVVGRENVFAHHAARPFAAPVSTHAHGEIKLLVSTAGFVSNGVNRVRLSIGGRI